MHDIRWIRDNAEAFDRALSGRKNVPVSASGLIALDDARRAAILAVEQAQEKRNVASKAIGQAKAQKDEAKAQALMAEVAELKETLPKLEADRRDAEEALRKVLLEIPNLPAAGVPVGEGEAQNTEYFGPNGSPANGGSPTALSAAACGHPDRRRPARCGNTCSTHWNAATAAARASPTPT